MSMIRLRVRNIWRLLIIIIISGGVVSCETGTSRKSSEPMAYLKYFDLDGTLIAVKDGLPKLDARVVKTIEYNGQVEVYTTRTDSIDWDKELAMLNKFDLQSSRLKGMFDEDEETLGEGRKLLRYKPVNNETGVLKYWVEVDSLRMVNKIVIETKETTFAADEQQKIILEFGRYYGVNPILTSYRFSRKSDVRQLGEETMSVQARIMHDNPNVQI